MSCVRVLVREDVGEPGLALLREHFDVEVGFDWSAANFFAALGPRKPSTWALAQVSSARVSSGKAPLTARP